MADYKELFGKLADKVKDVGLTALTLGLIVASFI